MYILMIVGICFLIPIFFTVKFQIEKMIKEPEVPELSVERYSYRDFATIRLLHKDTGEIEEVPLDEYIAEVVSAEMPVSYEPEALKAQSVAARTYTLYKILSGTPHENADICDKANCCQAWISKEGRMEKWEDNKMEKWNKIVEAVNATIGEVIAYEGKVINAFFHANSGGMTENVSDVWGGTNLPYLEPVETQGENNYPQYASEVSFTKEEFLQKIKEKYPESEISFDDENWMEIKEYTPGKRVKKVRFGNQELLRNRGKNYFWIKISQFYIKQRR